MVGKSQAENHFLFGPVPGDQAGQLPQEVQALAIKIWQEETAHGCDSRHFHMTAIYKFWDTFTAQFLSACHVQVGKSSRV